MMTAKAMQSADESSGGQLVSVEGLALPLVGARVSVEARGGLARTVLEQRFRNPHPDPLRVTYRFPLPHDGAVSGFAFRIGDRRVVGEVDRRDVARERFEEAIASGRTATILDEERGSVFTQEVGNVPAGAELVAELTVDQRLVWLPTGAWEWRFPMAIAPRYQSPGRVPDGERVHVTVADSPLPARLALALRVVDALPDGRSAESPSHAMSFRTDAGALTGAFTAEGGVPLDRDVVVRWPVASPEVGLSLHAFRANDGPLAGNAFGLLTLVPPEQDPRPQDFPRDLIVLIDTSGSMAGEPLAHARRVVSALVDGLRDDDTLELIEFSHRPRRWMSAAVHATAEHRRAALDWLSRLEAGGATEMLHAVSEALAGIRDGAQRQILLVTDGHIGSEAEIVGELLRSLPPASRLHTLGVGSGVNRSLLGPAARAGRGTESIVGIGEDVERAVATLLARMEAPLVTEVSLSGDAVVEHAPSRLPDLCAASPALLSVRLRPEGGALQVTGRTPAGPWTRTIRVPPIERGAGLPAIGALFGREAVEDLETRLAGGAARAEVDAEVERLGLVHQISTRMTSWIAISEEPSVDPTRPTRRVLVPQELPYGMSIEGLGLRHAGSASPALKGCLHQAELRDLAVVPGGMPWDVESRAGRADASRAAPSSIPDSRTGIDFEQSALPQSTLDGRIVVDRAGELVVEIDLGEDRAWSLPREVGLLLRDGSARAARVVKERTTAAGKLMRGQVLRIALAFKGPAIGTSLASLLLVLDGEGVTVKLRPSPSRTGRR